MKVLGIPSIDAADPSVLDAAAAWVARGGVLVYPTETLYALGGRALDAAASRLVRAIKGREEAKPLPVIAADEQQARGLAREWPEVATALAHVFWPGPLTLVVRGVSSLPVELTAGEGSVALRVTGAGFARALCSRVGPLISTSANSAGLPPPSRIEELEGAVGESAGLVVDGGRLRGRPSTIVDVTGPPRLVREGAIAWSAVKARLSSSSC